MQVKVFCKNPSKLKIGSNTEKDTQYYEFSDFEVRFDVALPSYS
jgi:hypothetical protein